MSQRLQTYRNDSLTVTFDPDVCTHSGECVRGLPAVFDLTHARWIRLENGAADAIAALVARCPSGALQAQRHAAADGGAGASAGSGGAAGSAAGSAGGAGTPVSPVVVQLAQNGPLLVRGPVRVETADGSVVCEGDKPIALCRCGGTGNAPFCDGTHSKKGFSPSR